MEIIYKNHGLKTTQNHNRIKLTAALFTALLLALLLTGCGGGSKAEDDGNPVVPPPAVEPPPRVAASVLKACNSGDLTDLKKEYMWNDPAAGAKVHCRFVSVTGKGKMDGSSWEDAYSVSALRDLGNNGPTDVTADAAADNIYIYVVRAGVYTPTADKNKRDVSFNLRSYVAVIGELEGKTVFSGDIDGDGTKNGNSIHVFYSEYTNYSLLADATVTAGNADGATSNSGGGGVRFQTSIITVSRVIIKGNSASGGGGGFYCTVFNPADKRFSPTLNDVTISANSAGEYGGGLYTASYCTMTLNRITISANFAGKKGGGMAISDLTYPVLFNVTVSGNSATESGGGIFVVAPSLPRMYGVTIINNTSKSGGGMFIANSKPTTLVNSILWGNTATASTGNQIEFSGNKDVTLSHVILQGGTDGILNPSNSTIKQRLIYTVDPGLSPLAKNGGFVESAAIGAGSPAINAGLYVRLTADNTLYYSSDNSTWHDNPLLNSAVNAATADAATPVTTDARGYGFVDEPDIGAYEYGGTAP